MPLPAGWNLAQTGASNPSYDFEGSMGFGIPAQQSGLQELFRLISQRGRTDPRLMNRNFAAVDRGTQSAQDATAGMAARSGLGGSGLLQAIQASQGQAGLSQKAGLRAAEAAQQDQNQRMNLQLLRDLVIGPGMDLLGLQRQLAQAEKERRSNQNVGYLSALGGIIPG